MRVEGLEVRDKFGGQELFKNCWFVLGWLSISSIVTVCGVCS